jgi:GAF domain-containing protein
LLHEARLVGTLAVGSVSGQRLLSQQDAELLELLGSTAAAALAAL